MYCLCFGIKVASIFNSKASQWVKGRQNWRERLVQDSKILKKESIWIHCSSLGEFEQARPLIDELKNMYPEKSMVVSFFSPSGYNIRKNYPHADLVTYLPCDLPGNAQFFIETINPVLVIFVKYDLWFTYFRVLRKLNIPLLIVSVIQNRTLGYNPGDIFKKECYRLASAIYVQDIASSDFLKRSLNVPIIVAGDTRIDSVVNFAQLLDENLDKKIRFFLQNKDCFIFGSTWPADEALIMDLINSQEFEGWKAIIAPHEMKKDNLLKLKDSVKGSALFFSEFEKITTSHRVLIVDSIGFLSKIYRYGSIAYIGGGFGKAIHNTLEPAAFKLPVLFGPKYHKFAEAVKLVKVGAFIPVSSKAEILNAFNYFKSEQNRSAAGENINQFLEMNRGASKKILDDIKSHYISVSK